MNVDPITAAVRLPLQATPAPVTARATPQAPAPAAHGPAEPVRRAAAEASRALAQKASELTFEFDDAAGRVIVRLVDKRTGEVLRQIPSEEVLAIARALQDETGAGALLRTDA